MPAVGLWPVWTVETTLAASVPLILATRRIPLKSSRSTINFCQVFREAWFNAVTPANVCGGFKKPGVYPFNPKAVPLSNTHSEEDHVTDNAGDEDHSNY